MVSFLVWEKDVVCCPVRNVHEVLPPKWGNLWRIVPITQCPAVDPTALMAVDFLRRSKQCGIKRAYLEYSPSSLMKSIDSARKCDSSHSITRPSSRYGTPANIITSYPN